jgi:general secretion pathway protein C
MTTRMRAGLALAMTVGALAASPGWAEAGASRRAQPRPLSLPKLARLLGLNPAQPCDVGLRLVGTLIASRQEWSMALLEETEESRTRSVRVGDVVAGHRIVQIERRRITLSDGTAQELLELEPGLPSPDLPDPSIATRTSGDDVDYVPLVMTEQGSEAMSVPRLIPIFTHGQFTGFRIFPRPGSIYEQLGLKDGDIIRRVDDVVVDSPVRGLEMYARLRSATFVEIELERDGEVLYQRYQLRR